MPWSSLCLAAALPLLLKEEGDGFEQQPRMSIDKLIDIVDGAYFVSLYEYRLNLGPCLHVCKPLSTAQDICVCVCM